MMYSLLGFCLAVLLPGMVTALACDSPGRCNNGGTCHNGASETEYWCECTETYGGSSCWAPLKPIEDDIAETSMLSSTMWDCFEALESYANNGVKCIPTEPWRRDCPVTCGIGSRTETFSCDGTMETCGVSCCLSACPGSGVIEVDNKQDAINILGTDKANVHLYTVTRCDPQTGSGYMFKLYQNRPDSTGNIDRVLLKCPCCCDHFVSVVPSAVVQPGPFCEAIQDMMSLIEWIWGCFCWYP